MVLNIAIIGHIDHGKSTLIGRILYDTNSIPKEKLEEILGLSKSLGKDIEFAFIVDSLEEERKRLMTIETTQTFFKTKKREYAIIDAPGHKEFLKNMATGVSQAHLAILVIDAKEGVKEQTKRHAYVSNLLGINDFIVLINKMDLVNYSKEIFEKNKKEIKEYLKKIGINIIKILPVSALKGDNIVSKSYNMKWYDDLTLIETLDSFNFKEKNYEKTVFCVQDIFKLFNKEIYLGNLISGNIREEQKFVCYPEGENVIIKKILYGSRNVKYIQSPSAIGIITNKKLKRGNVLCNAKLIIANEIKVPIFCLTEKIEENKYYKLKCFTQETDCYIEKIEEKINIENLSTKKAATIYPAEIGIVKMKLKKIIVLEKMKEIKELGRFTLIKNERIIGGGIIT